MHILHVFYSLFIFILYERTIVLAEEDDQTQCLRDCQISLEDRIVQELLNSIKGGGNISSSDIPQGNKTVNGTNDNDPSVPAFSSPRITFIFDYYNPSWWPRQYLKHKNNTNTNNTSMIQNNTNPYAAFCEVGCTKFLSTSYPTVRKDLDECFDQCNDIYYYKVSVGYNELAELAKVECRDGCWMALKRCKPGYFCKQPTVSQPLWKRNMNPSESNNASSLMDHVLNSRKNDTISDIDNNNTVQDEVDKAAVTWAKLVDDDDDDLHGGYMERCSPGTYRDVSFDAVDECIPCPPGRFREDIKGRNLDSCTKCPVGTYSPSYGSKSILNCLSCPPGSFTNEPGSEKCICITPMSCPDGHFLK